MRSARRTTFLVLALLALGRCSDETEAGPPSGRASSAEGGNGARPSRSIVALADHFQDADGGASEAPERSARHWRFDEERLDWKSASTSPDPADRAVSREQLADALRVTPTPGARSGGSLSLGVYTELDDCNADDWSSVVVRARTHDRLAGLGIVCNVGRGELPGTFSFFMGGESTSPVFSDGSVQDYHLPLPALEPGSALESFGVFFGAVGPGCLEILEVTLVPRGADFPESIGARAVTRDSETRRTLFAHTPLDLSFELEATTLERLDLGLACLPGEKVHYRILGRPAGAEKEEVLLDENYADSGAWGQRSLDLRPLRGPSIELRLVAEGESGGEVALFGAPILSRTAGSERPNVIFYVIDGGGADEMSLYRYGRPTTPFLEELAEEGVVFERAFSNATWTQPSTVSFMTSLHHSVLGGLRRGVHSTPIPANATPFAEHMRRGGFTTASFSANPNAGRVVGLERGMDVQHDHETGSHSTSSKELHERYWQWRKDYPAEPYWVHFQTTDVHEPNEPVAPFAGLYVSPERRGELDEWEGRMWQAGGDLFGRTSISDFYDRALERAGIDRKAFFEGRRGLYDETVHHQDLALRELVDGLKARGEWEHTLLVIGADHGHPAGTFSRWGRALFDPQPPPWEGALFDSFSTRVPLVFVWPGRLPAGVRVAQPVSMIDVLPTVLELCGLERPEICQGHSLVPLLTGSSKEHPPVVLDEFRIDEHTGQPIGNLELVEGRFGASLEIGPSPKTGEPIEVGRSAVPAGGRWGAVHPFFAEVPRLLLYDLEADPFALHAVNAEHPEEVARFEKQLRDLWEAHRALATRFEHAEGAALTPEQLETLKTLGYIR